MDESPLIMNGRYTTRHGCSASGFAVQHSRLGGEPLDWLVRSGFSVSYVTALRQSWFGGALWSVSITWDEVPSAFDDDEAFLTALMSDG